MGYGWLGDQIPVRVRFSIPFQNGILNSGYWVAFPEVKWLGCGINHPFQSNVEVKEGVKLYLYSPSGLSWPVLGQTFFSPLTFRSRVEATLPSTEGSTKLF
jgi:hypothetical protein